MTRWNGQACVLSNYVRPLFSVPRWAIVAVGPFALVFLLVGVWVADTAAHAGEVPRNVTIAGRAVGGLGEEDLKRRVEDIAVSFRARPVRVETASGPVWMTASELGVDIDVDATIESVLAHAGASGPVGWLGSFVEPTSADLMFEFDPDGATGRINSEDLIRISATEPRLDGSSGRLEVIEGIPGQMIDAQAMAAGIPDAINSSSVGTVTIDAQWKDAPPRLVADDFAPLIDEANAVIEANARVRINSFSSPLPAETSATWFASELAADGTPILVVDHEKALDDLADLLAAGNIGASNEAVWRVENGKPFVESTQLAQVCCEAHALSVLLDNLKAGRTDGIELPVRVFSAREVLDSVAGLGIRDEVATFTTYHAAGQGRVRNIQRFADLLRGHVILPGESVSMNELVGRRTIANGFVPGGAIIAGVLKSDVGGGVSQVATTMFNAAFLAGLEFDSYQAHSLYFTRYPYGREATISWPAPDLVIANSTPYAVMIWTSYTDTSITVALYSTKYVEVRQTGQTTSFHDQCRRVRTERTRWYLHGEMAVDYVGALYRPEEGYNCDGTPSDPSVTTLPPEDEGEAGIQSGGEDVVATP